jgi:malate dehydrogenase
VKGLPVDDFAKGRLQHTLKELLEERDAVASLLA